MVIRSKVKRNEYYDSVFLMRISNDILAFEGIRRSAAMMASDTNKRFLDQIGLLTEETRSAGPNDLVIAVDAEDTKVSETAISKVEELIQEKSRAYVKTAYRTLNMAIKAMPKANLALISVPGTYAKREALKALEKGLHVQIFSSNVPIKDELELKRFAREKDLLLMGPDCGTAIINNVVLGFGNAVKSGPIGIVGASGTGIQEVTTLIHKMGMGISHAIGTGSRDLSEHIGGIMMIEGIKALEDDENTEIIVLLSKPPSTKAKENILEFVKKCKKPIVMCSIGGKVTAVEKTRPIYATTLEDAAVKATSLLGEMKVKSAPFTLSKEEITSILAMVMAQLYDEQKYMRGLFSGGSLCIEALSILEDFIGPVYSNVHFNPRFKLKDSHESIKNTCVDMGTEEFTVGRPHPMIDLSLRKDRLIRESRDPEVAVVLLDVVLGYGSHPDPAEELAQVIEHGKEIAKQDERYLSVVCSICGTEKDPQSLIEQKKKLIKAGAILMPSNAQAARLSALIVTRGKQLNKLFIRS